MMRYRYVDFIRYDIDALFVSGDVLLEEHFRKWFIANKL